MIAVPMIDHIPSFRRLVSDHVLHRLACAGEVQSIAPNTVLLKEGELGTHLYVVEDGVFRVERQGVVIRPGAIGAGEVVGEFAFFDNRPRMATITATTAGRVRRLERQQILTALGDAPHLLRELLDALLQTLRARQEVPNREASFSPRQYVESLAADALRHRAVNHPYLKALASGDVPDLRGALADFARQYYGYSGHFPRYLTTVISRLETPSHRKALLENLTEESGNYEEEELLELARFGVAPEWIVGIPHPELFRRFQEAVGVTPNPQEEDALEVVAWREMFLAALATGSAAEAIGALGLGTETIVRTIYGPFVQAIESVGDLRASDTVFFPLHTAVDDHHQETLLQIAADFARTPEGRRNLAKGMRKALALRSAFWDWMEERAMEMPERASVKAA